MDWPFMTQSCGEIAPVLRNLKALERERLICVDWRDGAHLPEDARLLWDEIMSRAEYILRPPVFNDEIGPFYPGPVPKKIVRKLTGSSYYKAFVSIGRRDGFACRSCGRAPKDLQIDHVRPVSKGGSDDLDNLQLLCAPCNSSKHNRWSEEDV